MFPMTPRSAALATLVLAATTMLAAPALADDWPGFRGPDQTGAIDARGLFEGAGPGLERAWQTAAGPAYSSLAIKDGRVLTLSSDDTSDLLVALAGRTGTVLWQRVLGPLTPGHDGSENGPSSTPTVHGDRVYVLAADGRLQVFALEDGAPLWQADVHAIEGLDEPDLPPGHQAGLEGGPGIPFYGHAASPLVVGELVVVARGTSPAATLAAYDRETGGLRWTALPGKIEYQSPIAVRDQASGETRIVFWLDQQLAALTLQGEVAWSCQAPENTSASPIPVEDGRFLLVGERDSTLVDASAASAAAVASDGATPAAEGGAACATLWTSRKLKGGLSSPVVHEDTIYGFDRGFLTALDLETGETLWKSRPPGGNGLILVGDRLAIFASDGHVVLARTSREGYQEEARIRATERQSLTWPAFADGTLFVRDAKGIAAVRVTDQPMQLTRQAPPLIDGTRLAELIRAAQASDRPQLWVDHLFRSHSTFPLRESLATGQGQEQVVHFLYRDGDGELEDVGLTGAWLPGGQEVGLARLEGTDLFYRSLVVDPKLRIEYGFRLDFESIEVDPLNPRRVPGLFGGQRSELLPAEGTDPEVLAPYRGEHPGTVETFTLDSAARGEEREITVYVSAGQPAAGTARPLLVFANGDSWLRAGGVVNSLDHLVESGALPPMVAAFVPRNPQVWFLEEDGALMPDMSRLITDELLPQMRRRYGAGTEAKSTVLVAEDWTSSLALNTTLGHPESFGAAAVFSLPYDIGRTDELFDLAAAAAPGSARIFLGWNRFSGGDGEATAFGASRAYFAHLRQQPGIEALGGERFDTEGWGSRRLHVLEALQALLGD
ncbi:MAG: hypothetical protein DWQ36_19940 [Acidobacteria bacterium]|nr:MAG: hypothetical protein DWQ30_02935 [Acidobacteriota bacterium]REK03623.1 MAG: hypothetical protein DWQ36_19940 [Acidobacteriota bacterium]